MTPIQKKYGISGSTLKMIAIITMFIDHLGATVLRAITRLPAVTSDPSLSAVWADIYNASRDIGRIAFPIFCFFIVEGFCHTRNVWKYAGRLFLFSFISEIPFDIALKGSWYYPSKQNVYFTLLIGLLVIIGMSYCDKACHYVKHFLQSRFSKTAPVSSQTSACTSEYTSDCTSYTEILCTIVSLVCSFLVLSAGMKLANYINTDYNYKGVFLIAVLYLTRHARLYQCITGAVGVSWELPAPIAFIPVYLYNGTRGRQMKYFFYWFYPVHLMLLYAVTTYIIPVFQ